MTEIIIAFPLLEKMMRKKNLPVHTCAINLQNISISFGINFVPHHTIKIIYING